MSLESLAPSKLLNYVQKDALIAFLTPPKYAEVLSCVQPVAPTASLRALRACSIARSNGGGGGWRAAERLSRMSVAPCLPPCTWNCAVHFGFYSLVHQRLTDRKCASLRRSPATELKMSEVIAADAAVV